MALHLTKLRVVLLVLLVIFLAMGVGLLVRSHYAKKKTKEIVAVPEEALFTNPAWQARYLQWRNEYRNMFQPPSMRSKVGLKLLDGTSVLGELDEVTTSNITITVQDVPQTYNLEQLIPDTRAEYFVDDFAKRYALARVDEEMAASPEEPPPFTVAPPDTNAVTEIRYSMNDDIDIHMGPGSRFKKIPNMHVLKGSKVYIIDEHDGWIRCKRAPSDDQAIGWMHKFATMPIDELAPNRQEAEIALLKKLGFLTQIDPPHNEARVDADMWLILDIQVQIGMGRAMAFYCGQRKGTGRYWVDIRDAQSGRKLARYSESLGFKAF